MELNFTVQTNLVHVGQSMEGFKSFGPILNSIDSDDWLQNQKSLIGWTYSSSALSLNWMKFERLIVGRDFVSFSPTKIRCANNVHAKCYISKSSALLGSFNLTAPTVEDLCYLIKDKKIVEHLRKEFNRQWKALA
jgi:phosphatidylserine/phosphatidylglycerophosphate/cardiolipin synthase-like enzyme